MRLIGIVLVAAQVGAIMYLSGLHAAADWQIIAALLGLCGFVLWWDRRVIRR